MITPPPLGDAVAEALYGVGGVQWYQQCGYIHTGGTGGTTITQTQTTAATNGIDYTVYPVWVGQQQAQTVAITWGQWVEQRPITLTGTQVRSQQQQRLHEQYLRGQLQAQAQYIPTEPTPEQVRQHQEWQARQEAEREEALAAHTKAQVLLLTMLTRAQRESLEVRGYFDVIGQSGTHYRIYQGSHGNIRELDQSGRVVAYICGQPEGVPVGDMMLAQKLQLEADEAEFLRRANRRAA